MTPSTILIQIKAMVTFLKKIGARMIILFFIKENLNFLYNYHTCFPQYVDF